MYHDHDALDAEIHAYIARCEALEPAQPPAGAEAQRAQYRRLCRAFAAPRPPGLAIADHSLDLGDRRIAVRIYRPPSSAPSFCLVFFHGGGWVVGDLDTHDSIVAELAVKAGVVAVAVDYRLAPEHPYPAAVDDGWAVIDWLGRDGAHGLPAGRLAVAGDSAGGTIAAALALKARDRGHPPLAGQVLVYPALGHDFSLPSYVERAEAPVLTSADMRVYWQAYCGPPPSSDPYAVPLCAKSLNGLAPAFIVACEHDPLRDDAIAYVARLGDAGVPVQLRREPGLIHGFLRARHMSRIAMTSFDAIAGAVRAFACP